MYSKYEMNYSGLIKDRILTVRRYKTKIEVHFRRTDAGCTDYDPDGTLRHYIQIFSTQISSIKYEVPALKGVTKREFENAMKIVCLDFCNRIFKAGDIYPGDLHPILSNIVEWHPNQEKLEKFLSCFTYTWPEFQFPNISTQGTKTGKTK